MCSSDLLHFIPSGPLSYILPRRPRTNGFLPSRFVQRIFKDSGGGGWRTELCGDKLQPSSLVTVVVSKVLLFLSG